MGVFYFERVPVFVSGDSWNPRNISFRINE
jgi:hypothetical protein